MIALPMIYDMTNVTVADLYTTVRINSDVTSNDAATAALAELCQRAVGFERLTGHLKVLVNQYPRFSITKADIERLKDQVLIETVHGGSTVYTLETPKPQYAGLGIGVLLERAVAAVGADDKPEFKKVFDAIQHKRDNAAVYGPLGENLKIALRVIEALAKDRL